MHHTPHHHNSVHHHRHHHYPTHSSLHQTKGTPSSLKGAIAISIAVFIFSLIFLGVAIFFIINAANGKFPPAFLPIFIIVSVFGLVFSAISVINIARFIKISKNVIVDAPEANDNQTVNEKTTSSR